MKSRPLPPAPCRRDPADLSAKAKSVLDDVTKPAPASKYAEIIAVVDKYIDAELSLWVIGDLLNKVVGAPGKDGAHNGSNVVLKRIAAELQRALGERARQFGFEYLRQLRKVAQAFLPGSRVPGLPWAVHRAAGDSVTLQKAHKAAQKSNRDLTVQFVLSFKRGRKSSDHPECITADGELARALTDANEKASNFKNYLTKNRGSLARRELEMVRDDLCEKNELAASLIEALRAIELIVTEALA
jgi:hypothetical protein